MSEPSHEQLMLTDASYKAGYSVGRAELEAEVELVRGLISSQGGPMQMFPCQSCGVEWPWPGVLSAGMSQCPPCLRAQLRAAEGTFLERVEEYFQKHGKAALVENARLRGKLRDAKGTIAALQKRLERVRLTGLNAPLVLELRDILQSSGGDKR